MSASSPDGDANPRHPMSSTAFYRLTRLSGLLAENVMWAIAILAFLMALLVGAMIWQIIGMRAELRHIAVGRAQKLELITDLLDAAYQRRLALVNITLAGDPIERDDEVLAFHRHGYAVGKAHKDFQALPLDDFERSNLKRQDTLIDRIVYFQEEALDRVVAEDPAAAKQLMAGQLRSLDGQFGDLVLALRQYEQRQIGVDGDRADARVVVAIRQGLILGLVSVALAVLIGLSVRRLLCQQARHIADNLDALRLSGERPPNEATHDPLTHLANRTLFDKLAAEAIQRARGTGREVALLYLDMDRFKPVNDTYGYTVGDQLLQVVAQRLNASVRQSDTVARLGGDKFAILLDNLHGSDAPRQLGEVIRERLASPVSLAGSMLHPQVSLGLAVFPLDGASPEALLAAAEQALVRTRQERQKTH